MDESSPEKDLLYVGVHWIRGSVPASDFTQFKEYLMVWFGTEFTDQLYGLWFYDRSTRWPSGVQLNYHSTNQRNSMTNDRIAVEIPGHALDPMTMAEVEMMCQGFSAMFDFQVSRMDLYADDLERLVTPSHLYNLIYQEDEQGQPIQKDFSGFRRITRRVISNDQGRCFDECCFGSRGQNGSGKYLRVYDKRLESKGQNPAVRWELELSDDKAQETFKMVVGCGGYRDILATNIGAVIGGCIDFKKRTCRVGDKNLNRLERYEFWQKLIDKLGHAKIRMDQPPKSIDRAKDYIEKQVTGTLQMIRAAWGPEIFFEWLINIADDNNRLRQAHINAIQEYKRKIETDRTIDIKNVRQYFDEKGIQLEGEGKCTGQVTESH